MQFEIAHLKGELEKQFKKAISSQMAATNKTRAFVHEQEREKMGREEKQATPGPQSSFKMTLNRIASLAQNSIRQSQEKSSVGGGGLGYPGMNDSLDYMKNDFMNQFNQLAMTEKASADKSIGRQQEQNNTIMNSPLAKLVAHHAYNSVKDDTNRATIIERDLELKRLQLENLELKDLIEGMKNDMETIVLQVKEARLQADFAK